MRVLREVVLCLFCGAMLSRLPGDRENAVLANAAFPTRSAPVARAAAGENFLGRPDAGVLRALSTGEIRRADKGKGGRSLSFRVVLSDGSRAYFKPEQSFAAHWFSEVASFHVDRMLGLGRVTPVVSRRFPWSAFAQAAGRDPRLGELRRTRDGGVRGALIAWIDGELPPISPPAGWGSWLRIEEPRGAFPFQRSSDWKRGVAARRGDGGEPDIPDRPAELSDLVLFDYLIGNMDRWGGQFTNVRTLGRGGPLVLLDNANGFHRGVTRSRFLDAQLRAVQRFRRRTIEAIGAFDVELLRERLAREPEAPILDDSQLRAVEARRKLLLAHVAEMRRRHGDAATPW